MTHKPNLISILRTSAFRLDPSLTGEEAIVLRSLAAGQTDRQVCNGLRIPSATKFCPWPAQPLQPKRLLRKPEILQARQTKNTCVVNGACADCAGLPVARAREAFYDFAFCFLPRLPLFPGQCRVALFLSSDCGCFSMPLAL